MSWVTNPFPIVLKSGEYANSFRRDSLQERLPPITAIDDDERNLVDERVSEDEDAHTKTTSRTCSGAKYLLNLFLSYIKED